MKPKAIILSGYGLNCEEETRFAFETAGGAADIVHVNDLIDGSFSLKNYQILVFQGGFSYGDDTGAGNAYAEKVKNNLWEEITSFVQKDKLVIGICNGFQILVNLGLVPALNNKYGVREVALIHNNNTRYTVRWVDLKIENNTPWLTGIENIFLPIAHGEGKFYTSDEVLRKLKKQNMIAMRYIKGEMCAWLDLTANPNGSLDDIAGITDKTGRILGLMPHPERAQFFHQLPNWTSLIQQYKRIGKTIPKEGPGLKIFQNGVNYFK